MSTGSTATSSVKVPFAAVKKESTVHFFLLCPLYLDHRNDLLGEVSDMINNDVTQLPDDHSCDLLLFGSSNLHEIANNMILNATVRL